MKLKYVKSVIDYVICGVPDTSADKNVLNGAATLGEFKKKLNYMSGSGADLKREMYLG